GFVTKVKEETDVKTGSIKDIVDLFDLSPVLTDELLELSHWLTEKTLSYHITALQSMLPAAMKAKYEKEIQVLSDEELPQSLKELFGQRDSILYADIPAEQLKQIQKHVQKGHLEVRYHVSQKSGKKKVRTLQLAASKDKLEEKQQQLKKNAVKQ
ncbi:primosomal protein N', partial [Bacillus pumilus]